MFFLALIVGLMEVSPGICQMELINPDGTIDTSEVGCEYIIPTEQVTIPYRHAGGP